MFQKVLIANRGEIASRIMRTCQRLGIATVAVYSEADKGFPFVKEAGEAVLLGPSPPSASYLNIEAVLEAAHQAGADAIHPGYGFLSENITFAWRCKAEGLAFIGPDPPAIAAMGEKVPARELMRKAGIPVAPGTRAPISGPEEALKAANEVGYPLLVKPSAGGGGIGMTIVERAEKLLGALKTAQGRAERAFGRGEVFLERYIPNGRHIEVQVIFDNHGKSFHLWERECSVQRRYQKVLEESPSPGIGSNQELRISMARTALEASAAINYRNAGTVEFISGPGGDFYFLEMNTRLQVEHALTEMVTGLDLVELQLRVAAGEELNLEQEQIQSRGHAIEFRIYAEDPFTFLPSPGTLTTFRPPLQTNRVRLDCGVEEGSVISPFYDPLLAKLIVHGETRPEAISLGREALSNFKIEGIKNNIPLHLRILENQAFQQGRYDTNLLKQFR